MKKFISFFLMTVLITSALAGCANQNTPPTSTTKPTTTAVATKKPDVVAGASYATDEAKLMKAVSKDGTWIIILNSDLTVTKEIVVDGALSKPAATTPPASVTPAPPARKLALYAQDDKKNVTARYTLTAPKMTVKSPGFKIQSGTFVGDVYVEALGFNLVDAKVQGNIYYKTEDLKASFIMDAKSSVTGKQEVKK